MSGAMERGPLRAHVRTQLTKLEKQSPFYSPIIWGLLLLYIPFTTATYLFMTRNILVFVLEIVFVLMAFMGIYIKIDKARQAETEGNLYSDIRNHVGYDEIMEQAVVADLITLVVPGDPYPYHQAMIDFEEAEVLLKHLGADVKVLDTAEAAQEMDHYIREEATRLSNERIAKMKGKQKQSPHLEGDAFDLLQDVLIDSEQPKESKTTPTRRSIISSLKRRYKRRVEEKEAKVVETSKLHEVPKPGMTKEDLSVIWISQPIIDKLSTLEITTITHLSQSSPEVISKVKGVGPKSAQRLIDKAIQYRLDISDPQEETK